jgi:hypothetical protein
MLSAFCVDPYGEGYGLEYKKQQLARLADEANGLENSASGGSMVSAEGNTSTATAADKDNSNSSTVTDPVSRNATAALLPPEMPSNVSYFNTSNKFLLSYLKGKYTKGGEICLNPSLKNLLFSSAATLLEGRFGPILDSVHQDFYKLNGNISKWREILSDRYDASAKLVDTPLYPKFQNKEIIQNSK